MKYSQETIVLILVSIILFFIDILIKNEELSSYISGVSVEIIGIIIGIIVVNIIIESKRENEQAESLANFKKILSSSKKEDWLSPEELNINNLYIYKEKPRYSIEKIVEKEPSFMEEWIEKILEKKKHIKAAYRMTIVLKINNNIINVCKYVTIDGICVPIPGISQRNSLNSAVALFWKWDSVGFLVEKIIGGNTQDMDTMAAKGNIRIIS